MVKARVKTNSARALLELCRPRQWPKNLVVLAALLFSGAFLSASQSLKALAAVAAFLALSSAVYALNDLLDRERDRKHPLKRLRPLASGRVEKPAAIALGISLALGGLILAGVLGKAFLAVAAAYLLIQVAYSLWLKNQVILDVFVIAAGFVLRAVGGGVAIGVYVSEWLLLCASLLALFLGFAKRRQELVLLSGGAGKHRRILSEYSEPLLDQMMTIVAASTVLAYAIYAVGNHSWRGLPVMLATVPFVLYGVFRYLYLIHQKGLGGSPELVLLKDPWIRGVVMVWGLLSGVILFLVKRGGA